MALWMVLMSVLAAALDKLYEPLAERFLSLAESELSLVTGVEAQIEKLKRTKEGIQALLTDADERRYIEDDSVRLWLRRLKDVAFDADDLLDDYQTDLKASTGRKRKRPWHCCFIPSLTADPILLKRRRIANEIADIRDRLDDIDKERGSLRLREGEARRRTQARGDPPVNQTGGSLQDRLNICGRDRDVDQIIVELLKADVINDAPVIPLVGMAGLGKTAVAGLVFGDERIEEHFQLRIWVSFSKAEDEVTVTREIVQEIIKDKYEPLSLNSLQEQLVNLVRKKRFLLVMDNVMNEDSQFWERVRIPLLAGDEGSKVLITTRSTKVANVMSKGHIITLQGLGFDDCLLLFLERAFMQGGNNAPQNLVKIGKDIVRRCQGSPLAAKSLGGLLYNMTDEDEWNSVLKEMWAQEENENPILLALKVSYNHLPLHLKQCFGYCSIFPDGHEFDKDELVKLWMAEGFIQPRGRRRLEIIGSKYFDDLLWRSFFQNSNTNDQSKQKYKMPSLIHDLAQSVSIYECLRMEHETGHSESRNPRYASISHGCIDDKVFSELCGYENLRTLLLLYSEWNMPWKQALSGFFAKFRCLRTLDLRNSIVEELPNSIGDLKHLRYICLRNTQIRGLPESICSLYNLQTLELGECYRLLELPESMSNLVSLRHLGLHIDWDRGTDLISMPPGIGRLTNLQTLSRFTVTSGSGSGIGELKDLNLRGELCISKLENVVNVGDVEKANLNQKQYIEILMLKWSAITYTSAQGGAREEDVIGKLRPHSNLRNLWIENYNAIDFPSWIGDPSFTCLESLTLSCCKGCRILPEMGQLPKLTNLYIKGMEELESISSLPPALAKLELRNCRRLTTLPVEVLPVGLQNLVINKCDLLEQQYGIDGVDRPKIGHIPNLVIGS